MSNMYHGFTDQRIYWQRRIDGYKARLDVTGLALYAGQHAETVLANGGDPAPVLDYAKRAVVKINSSRMILNELRNAVTVKGRLQ